jgi:hypothetical protein
MAGQAAGTGINYLTGQTNPNVPNAVNQLGGTNSLFGSGSNYGSSNDPYSGLSKLIK